MDCSTPAFPVLHHLPELLKLMSIRSVMPLAAVFSKWAYFRLKGAGSKDLKTTKVYSLPILKATCPIQDVNKTTPHLKAVGRILLNLTFLWLYPFLGLWQCNSSLCLPPSSCGHFLCVCMSFSVSFMFTFIDVGIIQESACSAEDLGSIPGLGRSPGEGNGNPLQYSCLENFMDRGAWRATIYGVTKSQTWLSD